VVDRGVDYRLEPANPPSIEVEGEIRYGRSDAVPSRLDEPSAGAATVVLLASPDEVANRRSLAALDAVLPAGSDVVIVADGVEVGSATEHEVVRTSAPLGRGAALNIGIRRATGAVVVVIDPSVVPSGDVVSPLVEALRDPTVAVAGPIGLVSADLRRFEEIPTSTAPVDVAAIQGQLIAFRRADAAARGPIDEGFRFARYLDVWLSLTLRDEGEEARPRRAVAVPGLPLERGEPAAWGQKGAAERDRLSRRNAYRVLDRFRSRSDLAVPAAVVRSAADS
jgi:hypothetical protein